MGRKGDTPDSFTTFQYPALFALSLAIIDILFVAAMFRETLPLERRVRFHGRHYVGWYTLHHTYVCTNALLIHWILTVSVTSWTYVVELYCILLTEYMTTLIKHQCMLSLASFPGLPRFLFFGLHFCFHVLYWTQTEEQKTGEAWEQGYVVRLQRVSSYFCTLAPVQNKYDCNACY